MTDNEDLLTDLSRLVITASADRAPANDRRSDTRPATSTQQQGAAQAPAGRTERSEVAGEVLIARPGEGAPSFPSHAHDRRRKPQAPRTLHELIQFELLWTALAVPLTAIAKHYGCTVRSLHRWRKDAGLAPRRWLLNQGVGFARLYAVREQALGPILTPEVRALLVTASNRAFYYPWPSP